MPIDPAECERSAAKLLRVEPTLFQPLAATALKRGGVSQSSGLGLGLYIAYQIATAHGGSIAVKSTDAEGTTFTVQMPRHLAKAGPAAG